MIIILTRFNFHVTHLLGQFWDNKDFLLALIHSFHFSRRPETERRAFPVPARMGVPIYRLILLSKCTLMLL